jgi:hypothetical protein
MNLYQHHAKGIIIWCWYKGYGGRLGLKDEFFYFVLDQ